MCAYWFTLLFSFRPLRRLCLLGLSLGLFTTLLMLRSPILFAATIVVTNVNDSGPGSLRQAIADAAPGDTLNFAPGLSGQTLVLRSPLTLTQAITLDGSTLPDPLTLSGNHAVRVMAINPSVSAALIKLVIAHGRSKNGPGSGVYNQGILQVRDSIFYDNQSSFTGGAIGSYGTLTVTNSSFVENKAVYGGGISGSGSLLSVAGSTFISNQAHQMGGAIFTTQATIRSSTFLGNQAALGGAIRYSDRLTVFNSTFSANKAGSGGALTDSGSMLAHGKLWLYNSTLLDNEASYGSDLAASEFHLYNTLIEHSPGEACQASPNTNAHNAIADSSCVATMIGALGVGPLHFVNGLPQSYLLLPDSPAIDAGDDASCLATDQAGNARPYDGNADGVTRCDIGALERQPLTAAPELYLRGNDEWIDNGSRLPDLANHTDFGQTAQAYQSITRTFVISNVGAINLVNLSVTITGSHASDFQVTLPPPPLVVAGKSSAFQITFQSTVLGARQATVELRSNNNPAPLYTFALAGRDCRPVLTVTTIADAGPGSLRQALADLCSGGLITFAAALAGQEIVLADQLTLAKKLTLDGSGPAAAITLSGNQAVRVILVNPTAAVTLNRLIIANGRAPDGYGSGIKNSGSLTVTNSTLIHNVTPNYTTDLRFPPNAFGGGIYNGGKLLVHNSTFTGNGVEQSSGINSGGGIASLGATSVLTVTNSTFRENVANTGAGIAGPAYLYNTIIADSISGADCWNAAVENQTNLIEDGSCGATIAGDPMLGPLADNGGGSLTHALLPGSPAIDAGVVCSPTDQRGIARPLDGDGDGVAKCDLGAVEAAPLPTITPTLTNTTTNTPTPTPTNTATTMPPSATATPLPTSTATAVPSFAVAVTVALSQTNITVGEPITVVVTVANQPNGCQVAVHDLTLNQQGDSLFRFDSPQQVGPPVASQTTYTLTAIAPGQTTLVATAYGERNCGSGWQWTTVNGHMGPLTVTAAAVQRGDANGDQVIDRADIIACVQEIFDGDGQQTATGGSTSGCDANQDTVIDAGDASCIVLLSFDGRVVCGADNAGAAGETPAHLNIAPDRTVVAGKLLQVPIHLTTQGANVTAAAFRLTFDAEHFTLDPTDDNGDAIPDALVFALPALASQPLITVTAHPGIIDIFVTDLAAAPAVWSDGVFLTVTLRVHGVVSDAPVTTTIAFAAAVPPSLGSAVGASIPVEVTNRIVEIRPAELQLYLPLVQMQ